MQDLIARYDTLQGANEDLQKHRKSADARLEDLRGKAQGRSKQRQLKILELTTEIAQSQKVLEAAEVELNALEQQVGNKTTEESEQSLYLGMVLHSVDNLFQRCIEKRPAIQHRNEFMMFDRKLQVTFNTLKLIKTIYTLMKEVFGSEVLVLNYL